MSAIGPHDERLMTLALEQARQAAAMGEVPVGAVVADTASGEVIASAHNTRERDKDPSGHAEHTAIRLACCVVGDWRLNHCTLAVTLEPCPMCAGLIVNARVGRVVYGASDPKAGAVRTLYTICEDERLNHACDVIPGVLEDACAHELTSFFRALRDRR